MTSVRMERDGQFADVDEPSGSAAAMAALGWKRVTEGGEGPSPQPVYGRAVTTDGKVEDRAPVGPATAVLRSGEPVSPKGKPKGKPAPKPAAEVKRAENAFAGALAASRPPAASEAPPAPPPAPRSAPGPALAIPADWRDRSWPERKALASSLTSEPVATGADANRVIQAHLGK